MKETAQKEKIVIECENIEKDVPALETRKADLEAKVQGEESKLDEMLDGLKGEMAEIGAKIDGVEKELQPWEGKIAAREVNSTLPTQSESWCSKNMPKSRRT